MYTEKTENGYLVGESDVLAMNGTNTVNGPTITAPLGGNKIAVGVTVTVAGGADAAKLEMQYSFDGSNWSPKQELIADIVATATGTKVVLADLTAVRVPYYRLVLTGVTSLGTTGRFKLHYATGGTDFI